MTIERLIELRNYIMAQIKHFDECYMSTTEEIDILKIIDAEILRVKHEIEITKGGIHDLRKYYKRGDDDFMF